MSAATRQDAIPTFRLSTDDLPERDRLAAWREFYGRKFLRLEHEPLREDGFRLVLALRQLPGLGLVSLDLSPLRVGRTRSLIADGNDGVTFQISSTRGVARQLGREITVERGAAIGMSNADVGTFDFLQGSKVQALSLSRPMLANLVHGLDDLLVRAIPRENEALRLLKRYVGLMEDAVAISAPELTGLAAAHIYDLAALALGATREGAEIAEGRGVPAARRVAAKAFVREQLHRPDLRAAAVAAHLGVTPRYVHMLFERAGRSFLEYVLAERLTRARRMLLTDPTRPVTAIALAAGFNDLSYFNRTFRRRFGCTPTDVRAEARRDWSADRAG